ncbi:MAG: hypothetical protein HYX74_09265 [Acidobacteria bacterium]|nr:hypothetical protein [Acidobacteriota bacterium]
MQREPRPARSPRHGALDGAIGLKRNHNPTKPRLGQHCDHESRSDRSYSRAFQIVFRKAVHAYVYVHDHIYDYVHVHEYDHVHAHDHVCTYVEISTSAQATMLRA